MLRRAGNHSFSTRAKSFAVVMTAAATLAQFFALSHEMTVRHFRCGEHGDLTHVATMIDLPVVAFQPSGDAFRTQVAETVDAHEHCASAFTVEGSSAAPIVRVPARFTPPPSVSRVALFVVPRLDRVFVLASAPKTSPPSA
jgi:hypothetical protein